MVSASCDLGLFSPMSGRPISPMAEGDVELGEPTVSPVIVRGIEAGHVRMDENTDVRTRSSSEFGGVNPMARGTPPTVRGKVVQAASDDVDDDLPQATPVLVAMRSFNHQHSLSEIHAHVQARHAAPAEEEGDAAGSCFAHLVMFLIFALGLGMLISYIAMGIWSLVLAKQVTDNCKKLTNLLMMFGISTIGNFVCSCLLFFVRQGNDGNGDEHKEKESVLAGYSFVTMCFGFAIVTGNPPAWWGKGATDPDRCDPDGEVWPQMTDMFIVAFSLSMITLCCCCCVILKSASAD